MGPNWRGVFRPRREQDLAARGIPAEVVNLGVMRLSRRVWSPVQRPPEPGRFFYGGPSGVAMGFLSRISAKSRTLGHFLQFLWKRKLWWLVPFIVVLVIFIILAITAQTTGLGPFLYPVV